MASATAVVLGVVSGSAVLTAFGAVGAFDAVGSAVLVGHFRHALRHESVSLGRERIAHLVVSWGLTAVGAATAAGSAIRLAAHSHSHDSVIGVIVAATSVVVLGYLARSKHRLGREIPSRALVIDGWLSFAGCVIAIAALVGTVLTAALGWWWVDPIAAIGIGLGAVALGLANIRSRPPAD